MEVSDTGQPRSDDAPTRAENRGEEAPTLPRDPETIRDESRARDLVLGSGGATSRSTTHATPLEALQNEEIRRTRVFARITIPFALLVAVLLPLLGGDSVAKTVVASAMIAIVVTAVMLSWVIRADTGYTVPRAFAFGLVCVAGAYAGIYYFGVFSPAPVVIPFGLYFFSVGQSARATLTIYFICVITHLTLSFGIIAGAIRDRGIIVAERLTASEKLAVTVLVEFTFFATFLIARASRRALLSSIEDHDRAVRGLMQREELLKEARQDLERALEAGGLGRFSEEVLGSFRLGAVIGRGGMGEVYEAVHLTTHDPAAVKLLLGKALGDPTSVFRFLREARIAMSLQSDNVVKVLEVGGLEARVPFIAMERLRGQDLADVLRQHRRLALPKVVTLVRDVGRGLEAARAAGIVHRDLKPRNVFYAEVAGAHPVWKILDFGVSRLVDEQGTLTHGEVLGTPSYMAPEQVKSGKTDHKSDLYSLAVICYRALTGRPAFSGDQVAEILYKVAHTMPARPSLASRLPRDVDLALAIGLAKNPMDRFEHAADLATALEQAQSEALSEALREKGTLLEAAHPWSET